MFWSSSTTKCDTKEPVKPSRGWKGNIKHANIQKSLNRSLVVKNTCNISKKLDVYFKMRKANNGNGYLSAAVQLISFAYRSL